MRAMILAAGLGTRLKPLTDTVPKALLTIKGHTLLELQINKLKASGFDKIIINIHHFADMIEDYLKQNSFFDCDITLSDEREKLLDTGGGLKKASWFFNDGKPFLLHNVDVLSNLDLKNFWEFNANSDSIATLAVSQRASSRYFLFDVKNNLSGWRNEKAAIEKIVRGSVKDLTKFAFSGIQVIDPKLFNYFPREDVFSLVDLYLAAAQKDILSGFVHNPDEWIDLGKKENLAKAEFFFN